MPSTLRQIADDPHDAPIAPDIVPAEWADCVSQRPANDATSREKLFAEIRHAAATTAPKVDNTFRATDVNDIPALRNRSSARAWIKRAVMAFMFAFVSAIAAAAWKHHGDAATQTLADWVPSVGASSSPATETPAAAEPTTGAAAQRAADQPSDAAQAASGTAALPPEAEQQIQSMARDLAAMGQQIEQLKATIQQLRANQQAAVAPAPPAARPPALKPAQPKVTALPPRPAAPPPPAYQPRPAYPPAMQATAVPPPAAATAPPPAYQPPPQATTQPNGEPVVRPPMPMPLSDRY